MEVSMLVLSRKLNEKIVIDGNIVITVVKVDRNTVRLGIQAPEDITVLRSELVPGQAKARAQEPQPMMPADSVVVG
jgi:carbon storage regulator